MLDKINSLKTEIEGLTAANLDEVEVLRIKYLSKKGLVPALMNDFRSVPADQKRTVTSVSLSGDALSAERR